MVDCRLIEKFMDLMSIEMISKFHLLPRSLLLLLLPLLLLLLLPLLLLGLLLLSLLTVTLTEGGATT